jgi:ribosome-associated toxin RatA of RatAB toxin-antitoxin module
MKQTNTITMFAPLERIFATAADLEQWPRFLPHYRYIRYLERSPARNIVKMAAVRDWIPISWISEQVIDDVHREIRFRHLAAWSKGMEVVWRFVPLEKGIKVTIAHELKFRAPLLSPLVEPIIGGFFIDNIATKTLHHMKTFVEKA